MIFRQYLAINPVTAFYLFGCGGEGVAAVVDPLGDLDRYLCDADKTRADEPWLAFTGHTLPDESAFIAFMAQEVPPRPQNAGANRSANTGLAVIG